MIQKKSRILRRGKDRQGIEMVEFAMVLPFLMMSILGIIELGRGFELAQIANGASREGARLLMLHGVSKDPNVRAQDKIEQDIKNFLAASGISNNAVVVDFAYYRYPGSGTKDTDPTWLPLEDSDGEPVDSETFGMTDYMRVQVRIDSSHKSVLYLTPAFITTDIVGEFIVRHE